MFLIIFTVIITAAAGFAFAKKTLAGEERTKRIDNIFIILLLFGAVLRIVLAGMNYGHKTDVTDFLAWADMAFKGGLPGFYSSDAFTDYPPGYMYVLWVIGFIKNTVSISGAAELILIKLPAIAADCIIGSLLFVYARKMSGRNYCLLAALFIFNPAVILNSSIWGQVDSIMTLFVVITILLLCEKRIEAAYFTFMLSVFIKPQAFIFTPLLIYAFYENIIKDFDSRRLIKNLIYGFGALAGVVILSMPFGVKNVISQYSGTLASYPHVTVNAFNLWAALGQNWNDLSTLTTVIGGIFLVVITLTSFYILYKNKDSSRYFYAGAFLCFSTFMLSVKMHERYAYPVMALMLFSYVISGDFRHYILYILLSVSQLFNTAYILFIYETDPSKYYKSPVIVAASIINILIYLYFAFSSDRLSSPIKHLKDKKKTIVEKSESIAKFTKNDLAAMAVITAVYAVVAFSALGDMRAPQNEYMLEAGKDITLEFEESAEVSNIKYFLGSYPLDEKRSMTITLYDENGTKVKSMTENDSEVFYWSNIDAENTMAKSALLSASQAISLKEIYFKDSGGQGIKIVNADKYSGLLDEQETVPEQETYMNSTYFDEIYHARTAYEFINKLPVYEWTHPPLGKIFISLGIRFFGMTPFGWRCVGVFFGVLMVPVIYMLAKLLLKKTWLSCVTTVFFTFDFMHYAQTRISTIDVYVTFFIMLMYYFMLMYSKKSFYDTSLKKTFVPLGLCGISMGLAIACKWTGIYAAVGLAIIFFMTLYRRYQEYKLAKDEPDGCSGGILHLQIIEKFQTNTVKTLLFCCIFFVIIPIGIYMLSYIPYLAANGEGIWGIWKNQVDILTYHSKTVLESTHSYSSPWYTWPIIKRPIWYYSNSFQNGLKAGISAFGNPLVWWQGIASLIFCIVLAVKDRDKTAICLIIAYASNFLPWAAVERTTFIYHYFPSVPFVVLMGGYSLYKLYEHFRWIKKASFVYAICVIVLFAAFYPVLTGMPVNPNYVIKYLKWLPDWVLI